MNAGKTLFAQVMEFVPWKTFGRIVERYRGDAGVRTLGCAEVFRIMAFAQLTWRESLRDIETCMAANQGKLFHMGLRSPPARSTLAAALNLRDWRIYRALAERLIAHARALYAHDATVLDLDAAVYALDSTTIDLCLSLFGWAPFRSAKAASSCTRCSTCAARSQRSCTSRTASCTRSRYSTCSRWRQEASMSWTEATSPSGACTRSIGLALSSSPAPCRGWMRGASTRAPWTGPAA